MKRILCYGDSNTFGANPAWVPEWDSDPQKSVRLTKKDRWTGILGELLGDGYEVIEEGLNSRTTIFSDPITPYVNGKTYVVPCILTHRPIDLMVIMLGTNDIKTSFNPCEGTLQRAMEELLKEILNPYLWEHQKVANILLVSPPILRETIQNSPFYGMYDDKSVELSKKLAGLYEELAQKYGCYFLDAAQFAQASDLDCLHMDPENHRRLAKAICEKTKTIFAET